MKKLFLICISLALVAGKGTAQSSGLNLSSAELRERMALDSPQLYKKYKSGSTLSGVGAGLTLGGVAALFIGYATADKETIKEDGTTRVNLSGSGAAVFGVGLVCALAGTPLWIIGSTKKKNARSTYLRNFGDSAYTPVIHPSPYLQVNSTSNGLGLAFVF